MSADWNSVSEAARQTMQELGNFYPTVNFQDRLIKGYIDGKTYFSSDDLRTMASHFIEVADWLDKRAIEAK